ncbi:MAG: calcium/sodium antiporter [Bdellovibrio sp.]
MIIEIFFVILGLVILTAGGELLIKGSTTLAKIAGVPPLIIGLTIVAFGTGSPELAVSIHSSLLGKAEIALANVIGSNIFNIALILGIASMVGVLTVHLQLFKLDIPVMIGATALLQLMLWNNSLSRIEGIILFLLAVTYTIWLIRASRRENKSDLKEELDVPSISGDKKIVILKSFVFIGLGLAGLALGANLFVENSSNLARAFGISERVIGLTIIAMGTSLPELMTSVVAAYRGHSDIAVGNVVGSNIYNILLIGGLSGVIAPNGLTIEASMGRFDLPVALGMAIICYPLFKRNHKVQKFEGLFLLTLFAIYNLFLFKNT